MRLILISALILGFVAAIIAVPVADITFGQITSAATPTAAPLKALVARNEFSDKCDLNDGPCLVKRMDDNDKISTKLIQHTTSIAAPPAWPFDDAMRSVSAPVITRRAASPSNDQILSPCSDRCNRGDRQCLRVVIDTCADELIYGCKARCGTFDYGCIMDCIEGHYTATLPLPDIAGSDPLNRVGCSDAADRAISRYAAQPTATATQTSSAVPALPTSPTDEDRGFCMAQNCGDGLTDPEGRILGCLIGRHVLGDQIRKGLERHSVR
ncbi:hypothetical protein SLS55_003664 [Diplodia seriata]|uniref:Uncharacterized protein n=1 Tax=Diplodia seriata TaxID=420778 RepID=A0ABR3CNL6_9PEZI